MISSLLLLSNNDIPFISAQLTIHQPTLKEISLIGEDTFFTGIQTLMIKKENLAEIPPEYYDKISNLDILLKIGRDRDLSSRQSKACVLALLTLMFPDYKVSLAPTKLFLEDADKQQHEITGESFDELQQIVEDMFCVNLLGGGKPLPEYNPADAWAAAIANKIKKGRDKLAEIKASQNNGQKITILSRYISILAVGEQKDINALMQYNVYQLFDEFTRFSLREQSDFYLDAKMAGAKDLQPVDNWMKDIHSASAENN